MRNRPSCFGISVCYDEESKACKKCKFRESCFDESKKEAIAVATKYTPAKKTLYKKFNRKNVVVDESKKARRKRVSHIEAQHDQSKDYGYSLRTNDTLWSIHKQGIDIHQSLIDGINPFDSGKRFKHIGVACDLLLDGGFTKNSLHQNLKEVLQCSNSTARSYIYTIMAVLTHESAIENKNNNFRIKA